jgi:co-chaperonin GroES (HSP10)
VVVLLMRRAMTGGGIVIPSNIPDPQAYGKVLSLGEDVVNKNIKVGDIIVCHLNAGMDMVMERNLMRTLKYEEIYGVLDNKDFEKNLEEMVITGGSESLLTTASKPPLIRPVS